MRVLLEEVGGRDLWERYKSLEDKQQFGSQITPTTEAEEIYSAENCTINLTLPPRIANKLNQRQIWFLGQLRQEKEVNADDIAFQWRVSSRSAKSDIARMSGLRLIRFIGARKSGKYILMRWPGDRNSITISDLGGNRKTGGEKDEF